MEKSEFENFLAKIPKAEIHIHIEAVITLDSVRKLYKKSTGKDMSGEEQAELFSYTDLNGFIKAFIQVQNLFQSVDDFDLVFDDLASYLVANGIVYCEAFFAPTAFLKKGFSYPEMTAVFSRNIARIKEKYGITVRLLLDVSRTFGCENAMGNYKLLLDYPCADIIGIGLGGAEQKGPAREYAPVFERALAAGFRAVAHAGEDVGPESVWDTLNFLHAQRIGHGITSVQDEKLVEKLASERIPLEVCITSNTFTGKVVREARNHPIKYFFDRGILVTVNTDDPVFFRTNLLDEFWICYSEIGFRMDDIKQLVKNSFIASFLSEDEKNDWCAKVDSAWN